MSKDVTTAVNMDEPMIARGSCKGMGIIGMVAMVLSNHDSMASDEKMLSEPANNLSKASPFWAVVVFLSLKIGRALIKILTPSFTSRITCLKTPTKQLRMPSINIEKEVLKNPLHRVLEQRKRMCPQVVFHSP